MGESPRFRGCTGRLSPAPGIDLWAARERARRGDRDAAIAVMCKSWRSWTRQEWLLPRRLGHRRLVKAPLERGAEAT